MSSEQNIAESFRLSNERIFNNEFSKKLNSLFNSMAKDIDSINEDNFENILLLEKEDIKFDNYANIKKDIISFIKENKEKIKKWLFELNSFIETEFIKNWSFPSIQDIWIKVYNIISKYSIMVWIFWFLDPAINNLKKWNFNPYDFFPFWYYIININNKLEIWRYNLNEN